MRFWRVKNLRLFYAYIMYIHGARVAKELVDLPILVSYYGRRSADGLNLSALKLDWNANVMPTQCIIHDDVMFSYL